MKAEMLFCRIPNEANIKIGQNHINGQSWALESERGTAPLVGHSKPCNKTLASPYYTITTASMIPATLNSPSNPFPFPFLTDKCHWWGIPPDTSSDYSCGYIILVIFVSSSALFPQTLYYLHPTYLAYAHPHRQKLKVDAKTLSTQVAFRL